ncbi:PF20097 family protein [Atopobacter phocae]|uniref:PF20097 family protein n=1 Tax=Atopobacter phocae TaxID=136492 RepID=UPI00046ED307|nr:PF20097 family protein [Atopobacter phocae]
MKCTTCDSKMAKGYLLGDRYAIKWQPENTKLLAGVFAKGGITLKNMSSFLRRPKTEAYVCNTCKVLTVDLKTQRQI